MFHRRFLMTTDYNNYLAVDLEGTPYLAALAYDCDCVCVRTTGCKSSRHNDDDEGVSFVSGTDYVCRTRYVRSRSHPAFHWWFIVESGSTTESEGNSLSLSSRVIDIIVIRQFDRTSQSWYNRYCQIVYFAIHGRLFIPSDC